MEHGRLDSILDSSQIPGIDPPPPITRPKLPAQLLFFMWMKSLLSGCYEKKTCGRRNSAAAHLKFRIQIEKLFARE